MKIEKYEGRALPLRGNDVDTDRIIPARYMKVVTFEGLGQYAFYDVRFDEAGKPKQHPMNDKAYEGASIMVVNKNFGCGSSREHAPQSLLRWGVKAIIGESYAEIFAGNCTQLGIPAVKAASSDVEALQELITEHPSLNVSIDLVGKRVTAGTLAFAIDMPESYRKSIVEGLWDTTGILLANRAMIEEKNRQLPY